MSQAFGAAKGVLEWLACVSLHRSIARQFRKIIGGHELLLDKVMEAALWTNILMFSDAYHRSSQSSLPSSPLLHRFHRISRNTTPT